MASRLGPFLSPALRVTPSRLSTLRTRGFRTTATLKAEVVSSAPVKKPVGAFRGGYVLAFLLCLLISLDFWAIWELRYLKEAMPNHRPFTSKEYECTNGKQTGTGMVVGLGLRKELGVAIVQSPNPSCAHCYTIPPPYID